MWSESQALWEERRAARLDMQPLMQQLAQQLGRALRLGEAATLGELRRGCLEAGAVQGDSGSGAGGAQPQVVSEQVCSLRSCCGGQQTAAPACSAILAQMRSKAPTAGPLRPMVQLF